MIRKFYCYNFTVKQFDYIYITKKIEGKLLTFMTKTEKIYRFVSNLSYWWNICISKGKDVSLKFLHRQEWKEWRLSFALIAIKYWLMQAKHWSYKCCFCFYGFWNRVIGWANLPQSFERLISTLEPTTYRLDGGHLSYASH